MIGKWSSKRVDGFDPDSPVRAVDPTLEGEANVSTDPGPVAQRPPERYDVRVVLDGEEAGALNRLRIHLTERTQGAISATVSDTIRFALLVADWKINKQESDTDGERQ